MTPRLVAITGPLKGQVFPLNEASVSLGRESANLICVSDLSVSRRHCLFDRQGERFRVTDLNSRNGTFINGVPVKERLLEHGDQVKIADSIFLFLLQETEFVPAHGLVEIRDTDLVTRSEVQLRWEDALYLHPERFLAEAPGAARLARHFDALLKISTWINSIRGLEALQLKLLESILEVIPAHRAAILLGEEGLAEFSSVQGWERNQGVNRSVQVSRTIVHRVLREKVGILSNDVLDNESFRGAESLIASQIRWLVCVPLPLFEKVIGVIYVDSSDPETQLDEDHLQLMTAIARIAAFALDTARRMEWLEDENQRLQRDLNIEHNMIGESPRMREVYRFISRAAPTDSTVLIRGESGTGKELVARALHANSPRSAKPFVAINCAALSETLLESELFGHERGAFTGAIAQKKGKLEVADGGSVFLDEMGELAPALQAKLLRVLQEHEFERVGGTRPIKINVRLIAATNQNLEEAIRSGMFRQDLYFRLNVVLVTMPPLRKRTEDISLLVSYFIAKYGQKCGRRINGISPEARHCLLRYSWPGNVRELENAIERAVVLGSTDLILPEDLPENILESDASTAVSITRYHDAVKQRKKEIIIKAVEQAHGNYTEAAKLLGVNPNYLHRLIRNMNLKGELKNRQ
jgi:Nif-specific regulatory protein